METAEQNTKQVMEENDALKQFMELLNQQNMKEQLSQMQENQPKPVKENLMDKVAHLQEKVTSLSERLTAVRNRLLESSAQAVSTVK